MSYQIPNINVSQRTPSKYLITLKKTGDKPYLCDLLPFEYEAVKQGKEHYIAVSEFTPDGPQVLTESNGFAALAIDARNITSIQPYTNPNPYKVPIQKKGEGDTWKAPEEPSENNLEITVHCQKCGHSETYQDGQHFNQCFPDACPNCGTKLTADFTSFEVSLGE